MPLDNLMIVAALLVVAAVIAAVGVLMLRRRVAESAEGLESLVVALDAQAYALPEAFAGMRAGLAERGAVGEHVAWSLSRLDRRVDETAAAMRQARAGLDGLRLGLEGSRTSVDRASWALRTILKVIELRRAILG